MESLRSLAFHAVATPDPKSGFSVLHSICIEGDVKTVRFLLELSPNVVDTIIVIAVPVLSSSSSQFKGKILEEMLTLLDTPSHKSIQELLTLPCKGMAKRSLIHLAARQGNVHHINKLIAQGADVVTPSLEWSEEYATVINHAAEHNSIEVVEELLQHEASLQAKDYRGFNAIHFAARAGRTKTVLYMLDRDMSLRDAVGQGYTPLHLAAWGGHTATIEALITQGAEVNGGRQNTSYEDINYDVYPHCDLHSDRINDIGELSMFEIGTTPITLAAAGGHLKTFELLEQKGGRVDRSVLVPAAKGGNVSLLKKLFKAELDFSVRDNDDRTLLHHVTNGEAAKFLIDLGLDVMSVDHKHRTPLHDAARSCNVKVADVLIQHGADVGAKDYPGYTPLVEVVTNWNPAPDVVAYFVQKSRKSGSGEDGSERALMFADRFGPEVAKILLDSGLDVNKKGKHSTPLHKAAGGNSETVRIFVENGANIHIEDSFGCSPFHIAAQRGKTETLRLILAQDPNFVHAVNKHGETALHLASSGFHTRYAECVQFLLEHGSDVMAVRENGDTALHEAVNHYESNEEIVKTLLKHATSVVVNSSNSIVNAINKSGWTALHTATARDASSLVNLLLQNGFAINAVDNEGKTPLHLAANHSTYDVFKCLLESGADATAVDKKENTVLHSASVSYCSRITAIVAILFERGFADVHSRNVEGRTPLHVCAGSGGVAKARLFLEKGADINAVDNNGCTPLHCAAGFYDSEALELLIERGANVNAADNSGNTALHVAARANEDSVAILSEHGGDDTIANKNGETPPDLFALQNADQSNNNSDPDLDSTSDSGSNHSGDEQRSDTSDQDLNNGHGEIQ